MVTESDVQGGARAVWQRQSGAHLMHAGAFDTWIKGGGDMFDGYICK